MSKSFEEQIKEIIESKTKEIAERAAAHTAFVATMLYGEAAYYDAGVDAQVDVEPTADGYTVRATGDDVVFLEFGAGVTTDPLADSKVESSTIPLTEGSYSATHGMYYINNGYWYYKGQRISGVLPSNAMWLAREDTINQLPQIANEVFK